MIDKMKKKINIVKSNRTIWNVGWIFLVLSVIFSIRNNYGGTNIILQFASAAAPWVMLGIGIACCVASYTNKKEKHIEFENIISKTP